MKIVHVITRLLNAGSEENTILNCLYQAEQGNEVWIVHGDEFDSRHYDELPAKLHLVELKSLVHKLKPKIDYVATREFAEFCHRVGPKVVHTHQSKAGIIGRYGAKRAKVQTVIHGIHIAPFVNVGPAKAFLYTKAEKAAARQTDAFISVSAGMRDEFLKRRIGLEQDHYVVHSGMNIDGFKETAWPDDWRELLNMNEGQERRPPVVLMLAAFEPRKRHIEFIDAFESVLVSNPDTILLLGGGGPDIEKVKAYVHVAGLEKSVKILGHRKDPQKLIALADICALSSSQEGLPRVAVQSLTANKPIVISWLPGISEIVQDGFNGIVTDAVDVGKMGVAIQNLINDKDLYNRLSSGATTTDTSSWTVEEMCSNTLGIYHARVE